MDFRQNLCVWCTIDWSTIDYIGTREKKKNGYRILGWTSRGRIGSRPQPIASAAHVRDCFKIIEKDPGFGIHKNRAFATFGKILVVDRKTNNVVGPTKEYYECIRDNERIDTQNIAQQKNQVSQLDNRLNDKVEKLSKLVEEKEILNEENIIMLRRQMSRLLRR